MTKDSRLRVLTMAFLLAAFLSCRLLAETAELPVLLGADGETTQSVLNVIYDNDFEKLPLGPFDAVKWKDGKPPFIIDNTWTGNPVAE